MSNIIGIIGAMETEVSSLCQKLESKKVEEFSGLSFYSGKLGNTDVVVVKSGVGKVNAALCAQLLAVKFNVSKVINTGIAGATGKGLGVFDFVVSTKAVYHDFDVRIFGYKRGQVPGMEMYFEADKELSEKAVKVFNSTEFSKEHKIVKGCIASGDQFIADKTVKDDIVKTFDPMCVEMEGAAIAHACTLNKIPFVIIRCLSDCADDSATNTYEFNEDLCAKMCSEFVEKLVKEI